MTSFSCCLTARGRSEELSKDQGALPREYLGSQAPGQRRRDCRYRSGGRMVCSRQQQMQGKEEGFRDSATLFGLYRRRLHPARAAEPPGKYRTKYLTSEEKGGRRGTLKEALVSTEGMERRTVEGDACNAPSGPRFQVPGSRPQAPGPTAVCVAPASFSSTLHLGTNQWLRSSPGLSIGAGLIIACTGLSFTNWPQRLRAQIRQNSPGPCRCANVPRAPPHFGYFRSAVI